MQSGRSLPSLEVFLTPEQMHFIRNQRKFRNLVPLATVVQQIVEEARLRYEKTKK
jgi:hypothetical protein